MNIVAAQFIYPCDKIPDLAYDYLEHRLPVTTALRFRTHLKFCKNCHEFVRLYRMAADPLKFLEETPAPAELIEKTLAFVSRETEKKHPHEQ